MAPQIPAVNPAGQMVQGKTLCLDLQAAEPDAGLLVVESKTKNWPLLPKVKRFSELWAYGVKPDQLALIGQLSGLTLLCLRSPKCSDFSPITDLKKLHTLVIDDATQLTDLSFLRHMPRLKYLHLSDMKRLTDIGPLAECRGLVELHLESGIWNELNLVSLEPLRGLKKLRYLGLSPRMKKPSLKPLAGLVQLTELSLNGRFPFEDYARLAGKLKKTKCEHFTDMFSDFSDVKKCGKCGRQDLVIGAFLTAPKLCVHCDRVKIERWRDEFASLRDQSAARKNW